ncbi:TPA: restriction endonuclease subunit S [Klebsiella pneumoniae]
MSQVSLPSGWINLKFTDILDVQGGTQPPKSEFISEKQDGYIRLLQIRDFGKKPVPTFIPESKKLKKCNKQDLLIGRYGASLGRICTGHEGAYNVALAKVIYPKEIFLSYIRYYLESEEFQSPLRLLSRSAQNGFNKEDLSKFNFFLPSYAEQKIIADKLDDLLARVESIKTRLENIPEILKKFRQSVLSAAVSGKLTEVNASDYKEISSVAKVIGGLTKNGKRNQISQQFPYLRVANVYENELRLDDMSVIGVQDKELDRVLLHDGDILIVEGNGSLDQIGRAAIWNGEIENCVHQNHLIKVRVNDDINSKFLLYYFMSPQGKEEIVSKATSGAGLYTLSISKISSIKVPIYTVTEQVSIVNAIERLFSYVGFIEKTLDNTLSKINNLTQSILAKAFRGELTAQWREENPELISGLNSAEALLEKITAEKLAAGTVKKRTKKTSR